jgi:two-component system sensor kinase FixL
MGLGLSLSRSIIEAHMGKMWASSRAGDGTTFHFTLPAAEDRQPERATG